MKKLSIVVGITGIEPIKVCQIQEPPLYLSLFPYSFLLSQAKRIQTCPKNMHFKRKLHRERESNPQAFKALHIRTSHLCDLSRYLPTLISQPK